MKLSVPFVAVRSLSLLAAAPLALLPLASTAQPYTPQLQEQYAAQAQAYSQQQLDQILAPIALYPDGLLTQILMASTFPEEVMDAARWSRANPGLEGEAAVQAAQGMGWDPSVESLTAFPQVLAQMEQNFDWMRSLGHAFLVQEPMVMDAVQELRRRAHAAGTLRSDEQVRVEQSGPSFLIEPAQPQITYVPYYDPMVAYGAWPWASHPPVYWAPWAGYRSRPGYRSVFAWGPAVRYSYPARHGRIDWTQRRLHSPTYTRRDVRPNIESRRFDAPRIQSPRVDSPRFESRRFDSPNVEPRRFESRRTPDAAPRIQAPVVTRPAPAVTAEPRREEFRQRREEFRQQRREERRPDAGPRSAPGPRAAPAAPAAAAPAAAPAQRRDHPRGQARGQARGQEHGRGHRDNAQGGGRGEGRGRS